MLWITSKLNVPKTEQYTASATKHGWKKCKCLGSYLETTKDIENRKGKLIITANELDEILQNKKIPITTKVQAFNLYLSSIFLYNSELWTLTTSLNNSIDAFHRRMLRKYVFNIKYPTILTNKQIYEITKVTPWSNVIAIRRLVWFGHVCRLHEDTPAKKALHEHSIM